MSSVSTSHLKDYAKSILRHDFGQVVEQVADILITEGPLTREQIQIRSGLRTDQVKEGLIAMVAHHIVTSRQGNGRRMAAMTPNLGSSSTTSGSSYMYEIDLDMAFHRVSAPRYAPYVKSHYGKEAALVVEVFSKKGKLLRRQLNDACVTHLCSLVAKQVSEGALSREVQEEATERVNQAFEVLAHNGYIIAAITKPNDAQRSAKRRKKGQDLSNPALFWILNHDRFLRDLRHTALVDHVQRLINPTAAVLVRLMLQHQHEGERDDEESLKGRPGGMSRLALHEVVRERQHTPALDEDAVEHYLDELTFSEEGDGGGIVSNSSGGGLLRVDCQRMFEQLRAAECQRVVTGKFDKLAGRIFRLILRYKELEKKQVIELATAPKEDVLKQLLAMERAGFIEKKQIRHKSIPGMVYTLWTVPEAKVNTNLLCSFLRTWVRLKDDIAKSNADCKDVLDKVHSGAILTETEGDEYTKWKRKDDCLVHSLSKMANAIVLFRGFTSTL